jgi:hypothetical protein
VRSSRTARSTPSGSSPERRGIRSTFGHRRRPSVASARAAQQVRSDRASPVRPRARRRSGDRASVRRRRPTPPPRPAGRGPRGVVAPGDRAEGGEGLLAHEKPELRDRVRKAIGIAGRKLTRYLRVLETPVEAQRAFQAGTEPPVEAEKVAHLSITARDESALRIQGGEEAAVVIPRDLPVAGGDIGSGRSAFHRLVRHLRRGLENFEGRGAQLKPPPRGDAPRSVEVVAHDDRWNHHPPGRRCSRSDADLSRKRARTSSRAASCSESNSQELGHE